MGWENWFLYAIGLLVTAIGGIWVYLKTTYWPHKLKLEELRVQAELELQKKKAEEQEKQRHHEWEMAKRAADEQERQRQHEREVALQKAKSEAEEGGNLWKQVVEMQTTLMKRDEDKTEFLISLATDRMDRVDERAREAAKEIAQAQIAAAEKIAESYKAIAHQMIEMRTSMSVLVQDAVSREQERQALRKIPQNLLELLLQQQVFQDKMLTSVEEIKAHVKPSDGI